MKEGQSDSANPRHHYGHNAILVIAIATTAVLFSTPLFFRDKWSV